MDGCVMHIAAAANKKYVRYLYVMMQSALHNNPDYRICFYILSTDFDEDDKKLLSGLAQSYGGDASFPAVDSGLIADLGFPVNPRISEEAYFRLFLPEVMPGDVDRVLYLDVDIIIDGSLRELWETDFEGGLFAACIDHPQTSVDHVNESPLFAELRNDPKFAYVNSGVLLFNLTQLRKEVDMRDVIRECAQFADKLAYHDQDILNYKFYERIKHVDTEKYDLFARKAYEEGIRYADVKDKAVIIHFTGGKPWWGTSPHFDIERIWWEYAKMTPFYTELLEEVFMYEVDTCYYENYFEKLKAENDQLMEINAKCMEMLNRLLPQKEET